MWWTLGNDRTKTESECDSKHACKVHEGCGCGVDSKSVSERRECSRINFPPADTLVINNSEPPYLAEHFRVLNVLSEKSIGLVCIGDCNNCEMPVEMGKTVAGTIELHNGEEYRFKGQIIRYSSNLYTGNSSVVCLLEKRIPHEVIDSELAYLVCQYEGFLTEMRSEVEPDVLDAIN